jgi:MFS transporter, DHA3 family, macrolide efflux protein
VLVTFGARLLPLAIYPLPLAPMKNRRAFALLLAANIISGFAQGISMLSIPWYFVSVLDKGSLFGWIYMFITLGTMFWSLYAGTLVDRYPRKNVFQGINLAGGLVLGGVALHGFITGSTPMALVVLVFAATVFIYNIHYPSLYAFGQEISERQDYGKMNSYLEIQGQATTVVAGAVGAVLLSGTRGGVVNLLGFDVHLPFDIKPWELYEIFAVDALTYFMAIALIAFIRYTPAEKLEVHLGSVKERMKMGFDFLKRNRLIFLFGNMSHAIFVILLVEVHLLLPWYVNNHLEEGAGVYASSDITYAIGALFAGFFIRFLFRNSSTVMAVIILMFLTAAGCIVVAFTKSVFIFFAFSVLIGITNAGARILRITWLFNHIPNNMMGRTGSVFQLINIFLRSVFIALFSIPFFSWGSNVTWAYFIGALFILASAIPLMVKYRELHR